MLSRRVPLFLVSLAFATGCVVGLQGWLDLNTALVGIVLMGMAWLLTRRHESASLVTFYGLMVGGGLVHTLLISATIAPDDLRRLPDEKSLETTQWRGLIVEEPTTNKLPRANRQTLDRTSFVVDIDAWRPTGGRSFGSEIETAWRAAQGKMRCTVVGPADELECGDHLEFAAALIPPTSPLCPGEMDFAAYEARQGIYAQATLTSLNWRRAESRGGSWWPRLSYRARDWAYGRLQLGLEDDPRMADFLAGMLIGYRQEIPQDIQQDFRRTGTLHVFAISGQNIAEMLVVAIILLQLCGLVRWRWSWTLAPLVLTYCLLTGSPSSAVRATVMALAILLAWRLGRPLNALGCWSIALLTMLIWDPPMLLDPGAQLSFAVVLGIIFLSSPMARALVSFLRHDPLLPAQLLTSWQEREERLWFKMAFLLGATLAATLVSEPITAIDFHQVTPISPLANLIVVPLAGLITMVGTLSIAVSMVSWPLAALLNNANWLFAKLLIGFVGFLAHEPGAAINVPDLKTLRSPTPSFVVAPVLDSACLLIRISGHPWLINTGREVAAPTTVGHLLQFYGINQLEGLVLAQASTADNGGVAAILRDYRPRRVIVPPLVRHSPLEKILPDIWKEARIKPETWPEGSQADLGAGITVQVLNPPQESISAHAEDRALVLLFQAQGRTLLWGGKIDPATQETILASHPDLKADILVLGVEAAPTPAWLRELQVHFWLQIPPRDQQLNISTPTDLEPSPCAVWPLNETGAVELHFEKTGVLLQPWVTLPKIVP